VASGGVAPGSSDKRLLSDPGLQLVWLKEIRLTPRDESNPFGF